jgi:hypothetical protein
VVSFWWLVSVENVTMMVVPIAKKAVRKRGNKWRQRQQQSLEVTAAGKGETINTIPNFFGNATRQVTKG